MKRTGVFFAVITALAVSTSAAADEGREDTSEGWAASIATDGVFFRKHDDGRSGLFVGGALGFSDASGRHLVNDDASHIVAAEAGYRSYSPGNGGIHSFLQGSLRFTYIDGSDFYVRQTDVRLAYGLERYLSDEFSLEATAGVRLNYTDQRTLDMMTVVAPDTRLAINYYF